MASFCGYETDPNSESDINGDDDEKIDKQLRNLEITLVKQDGEWLYDHPWQSCKPDSNLKMKDTVAISASYKLDSVEWISYQSKRQVVDLSKIFSNLPTFIHYEMQGSINGSRQELEELMWGSFKPTMELAPHATETEPSKLPPHRREIVEKIISEKISDRNDKKYFPVYGCFKATSLDRPGCDQPGRNIHINCEYMLKMFVPESMIPWFDIQQCDTVYPPVQLIRKISYPNKEKRWIFIPSFRRAQIALLHWPEDDIVNQESTIRILVVRPSEFKEYAAYCGHMFPVICLPQDEIGAGYARYWIQKIALRLKLQFIWMIDDSVECFYWYHPVKRPPGGLYKLYAQRKFGLVFKRIEDFVKEADDSETPIAAMSPRRFNVKFHLPKPFVCKPPQGAVYLNLRALLTKNIFYRPELKTLEDMIFGYECEKKGLKVFMDNRVHLQDHNWKNSGARSPSVCKRQMEQKSGSN